MKELLTLSLTGIIIMLAEIINLRKFNFLLALIGLTATVTWCIFDYSVDINQHLYGMMVYDKFANAFTLVMSVTAVLWLMFAEDYFEKLPDATDRYALVLFVLVGSVTMVSYNNMSMLFIGIEILSISLYALAGSNKTDLSSNESAFKYFLMGAFASGFLLLGIALIYGGTGKFDLDDIRRAVANSPAVNFGLIKLGVLMLLIGLGFKVAAAPFHFWAPDVYQGAPTPITALMATIVKAAAMAAFYRLFSVCFTPIQNVWTDIIAVLIVMSLVVGNITAVMQHDAKRMLAYSSVSHVGYMLFTLLCMGAYSQQGLLFYTGAYSLATITAFTVLYIVQQAHQTTSISAFNGLGKSHPLLAIAMSLSLLSMAGIPPLAGFMAKYYIFASAISQGYIGLTLLGIAMSLVGIYYYFKIIIAMYAYTAEADEAKINVSPLQNIVLIAGCLALLVLGIFPQMLHGLI